MASRPRDNGGFAIQDQSAVGEREVDLLDSFEAQRDARVTQPSFFAVFCKFLHVFCGSHLHLHPQKPSQLLYPSSPFIPPFPKNLTLPILWRRSDMIRRAAVKDAGRRQNINAPYPRIHHHFPYPCQARTFGLTGSTPLLSTILLLIIVSTRFFRQFYWHALGRGFYRGL